VPCVSPVSYIDVYFPGNLTPYIAGRWHTWHRTPDPAPASSVNLILPQQPLDVFELELRAEGLAEASA
jgi:hypothetical protein